MNKTIAVAFSNIVVLALFISGAYADGWDPGTKATNKGGVQNTRHNLSQDYLPYNGAYQMNSFRNSYNDVCVYCHTPHGANSTINAPLWNRTNPGTTYTLYSKELTSGQTPTQPGPNSLTCLSCHDGTIAVDSIVNMPSTQATAYAGNYLQSQETSQNTSFLDSWRNPSGPDAPLHFPIAGNGSQSCGGMCHDSYSGLVDFTVFYIGTDLSDEHPVGVQLPDTSLYDFNLPTATSAGLKFYDTDSDGRADSTEIRLYDTGDGYEVECASCHDPHGAPSAGAGSVFVPSFLRVSNSSSALCLTCHNK